MVDKTKDKEWHNDEKLVPEKFLHCRDLLDEEIFRIGDSKKETPIEVVNITMNNIISNLSLGIGDLELTCMIYSAGLDPKAQEKDTYTENREIIE